MGVFAAGVVVDVFAGVVVAVVLVPHEEISEESTKAITNIKLKHNQMNFFRIYSPPSFFYNFPTPCGAERSLLSFQFYNYYFSFPH